MLIEAPGLTISAAAHHLGPAFTTGADRHFVPAAHRGT